MARPANLVLVSSSNPAMTDPMIEAREFTWWGSDCVMLGGCGGNTTPQSMECDACGSDEFTVALYVAPSLQAPSLFDASANGGGRTDG